MGCPSWEGHKPLLNYSHYSKHHTLLPLLKNPKGHLKTPFHTLLLLLMKIPLHDPLLLLLDPMQMRRAQRSGPPGYYCWPEQPCLPDHAIDSSPCCYSALSCQMDACQSQTHAQLSELQRACHGLSRLGLVATSDSHHLVLRQI